MTDDERKKALFLTICGAKTYQLVRNLVAPAKPDDRSLEQITDALNEHLSPTPNEICERFRFRNRMRKAGESVNDYVAELRQLTRFCDYKDRVDEEIRDQLVCGINDIAVQKKLLSQKGLTLVKAREIAVGAEAAEKEAASIRGAMAGGSREIHGLEHGNPVPKGVCFRCGDNRHLSSDCWFKDKDCFL